MAERLFMKCSDGTFREVIQWIGKDTVQVVSPNDSYTHRLAVFERGQATNDLWSLYTYEEVVVQRLLGNVKKLITVSAMEK